LNVRTSDFDYDLPGELIAQTPAVRRDAARMMVLDRATGRVGHHRFGDLPDLLRAGDLLVINDTAVIPARFDCRRQTGGRIEGLFCREDAPGQWEVMLKGAARCRTGEALTFAGDESIRAILESRAGEGLWRVRIDPPVGAMDLLRRIGRTPLPPYIRRPGPMGDSEDRQAYQTVYGTRPGAVAAPTAGLHFTPDVLSALTTRGVERAAVTLHVGLGTFAPVKAERVEDHRMHAEWYELPAPTADALVAAKAQGRRVVAVGTTSVRVLESVGAAGAIGPGSGWTDLFLYPPATFAVADAMLTNFHLPCSTLLMLVSAFAAPGTTDGIAMIHAAYAQAVRHRYRFYSYGDAMLIV